jgi:hypothetical protein
MKDALKRAHLSHGTLDIPNSSVMKYKIENTPNW